MRYFFSYYRVIVRLENLHPFLRSTAAGSVPFVILGLIVPLILGQFIMSSIESNTMEITDTIRVRANTSIVISALAYYVVGAIFAKR